MKAMHLTSLICGGLVSLAGGTLFAQTSTSPGASSHGTLGQPSTSGAYNSSTAGSQWSQHQGRHQVRLSHLMNATVQSQDGKTLGSIRDFAVDPQSGLIEFAILSPSSSTTLGSTSSTVTSTATGTTATGRDYSATGKLIPVPWQLFSQSWQGHQSTAAAAGTHGAMGSPTLTLNVDESKLQGAPSLEGNNWNELQQSQFDQRVYSYFGVSRMSGAGTPGSSVSGQGTSSLHNNGTRESTGDRTGRSAVPK